MRDKRGKVYVAIGDSVEFVEVRKGLTLRAIEHGFSEELKGITLPGSAVNLLPVLSDATISKVCKLAKCNYTWPKAR